MCAEVWRRAFHNFFFEQECILVAASRAFMAASTSRQAQRNSSLPGPAPPKKSRKSKGKERERDVLQERAPSPLNDTDDDPTAEWSWQSLTDSAASQFKPVFTKDGRSVPSSTQGVRLLTGVVI
jgi:hypothetical protein